MSTRFSTINKLKLITLVALFAAPLLLAVLLHTMGWRPQTGINYGELLQPARPIRSSALQTLDGTTTEFPTGRKKWTMLYFGSGQCGDACRADLYKMRQVHLALGKDAPRVQRVFIIAEAHGAGLNTLLTDYPDTQVLTGTPLQMRTLANQFDLTDLVTVSGRIFIVDPLGNWMMRYPAGADPSGMRKDFVRLLKVSQIG